MVNNKKALGLGATLLMLVSAGAALSSCGSSADLTYWCPSLDNKVMEEIVADFKADNPEYKDKTIKVLANMGEGETNAALHKDTTNAADVMLMVDDNVSTAIGAEDVLALPDADRTAFIASDGENAVNALSSNGKMYGYPYRADNSPMMLYDSTVVTATQALSLEDSLAACKAAGKKFYLDIGNGWYNPFLIWAGGGKFSVETVDGVKTIMCDFIKDTAKLDSCAASCQAFYDLYGQYKDIIVSNSIAATVEDGFAKNEIGVSFLWNDLATINGKNSNVVVTSWPTMKIKGVATPLTCFQSFKAVCVNAAIGGTARGDLAVAFAKYAAGAKAQTRRVTENGYGPSNLAVLASDDAQKIPWVKACNTMSASGRVVSQALTTTNNFWTPIGSFAGLITDQKNWGDYGSAAKALKGLVSNTGWAAKALA
jgi:arabinogalactan oligomer/maltooligosaccharide transport system substrate-binding protein